jgi:hypothetical protein
MQLVGLSRACNWLSEPDDSLCVTWNDVADGVSQGVAAGREFDWKTAELALHCVR